MIRLTRLNGGVMYLNADLVATVEHHHDTVLTLVDGKTYVLQDTAEEVVDAVREYRASIIAAAERMTAGDAETDPPQLAAVAHLRVLRPTGAHGPHTAGSAEPGQER